MARCNACKQEYKVGGKQYGTSSLNRHLPKCKQIKFEDVGQVMIDMQGKLKSMKIDQRISREMFSEAIIEHGMPFKFAEYKKFRRWHSYLCPDLIHISRNTLKKEVFSSYLKEKEKLKNTLATIRNRICLTSDLWTAVNGNGYICLTAHYVDTKWKLNNKILNFCHVPPPHTGFELSQQILDMLKDWEIEKKIFSITLDNASANDTMEGLKVSSDALNRIRESVRYVRSSEGRMKKFKECMEQVGDDNALNGMCVDCPTRWNFTYLMLDGAVKYQRVFAILQLNDRNFKDCPLADDWKKGENLFWKIQRVLIRMRNDKDEVVKSMAERMMVKFEKYWNEYSVVLALGAIDASTSNEKVEKIRIKLYELFDNYARTSSSNVNVQGDVSSRSSSQGSKDKKGWSDDFIDELKMHNHDLAINAGRS
ncbi:zinc finger BED domain-containing protein RICESLEEPER 2-like [Gastrolobium bilobum]|uniref:zinc finger BED domain-containing protein RICESLEEPER 2-like n=1 Tax=Gastrolobium bilobum TaxID=150636 RepID=UPI002AAFD2B7|nr:zinc finger BED domain-containing protein RICESLEEPER 2-like [Gastrolobium bilobum]